MIRFIEYFVWLFFFMCLIWIALAVRGHAHSWYDYECCSDEDCKPVPHESIEEKPNGDVTYTMPDGYKCHFSASQIRDGQDTEWHACIIEASHAGPNYGRSCRCIYRPARLF